MHQESHPIKSIYESKSLKLIKNASTINRGDQGSLGHRSQWDSPYTGNSKKENAIMTSFNKCQGNPPSFCFLSGMYFTAVKLVRKSNFGCNFEPFFFNFYCA